MSRQAYPTDLNDVQWLILEPLLLATLNLSGRGRPGQVELREIVNAIFYIPLRLLDETPCYTPQQENPKNRLSPD